MAKWEVPGFVQGLGRRVRPRFYPFVSNGFKIFLHGHRHGKTLLGSSASC